MDTDKDMADIFCRIEASNFSYYLGQLFDDKVSNKKEALDNAIEHLDKYKIRQKEWIQEMKKEDNK